MGNIFNGIGQQFGSEDFFSATYAYFLREYPEILESFLNILDVSANENLSADEWEVSTQAKYLAPNIGESFIDIALLSKNRPLDIWIECKLDSKEGKRQDAEGNDVSQLMKYEHAWKLKEEQDNRRTILVYLTKKIEQTVSFESLTIHEPGRSGYLKPTGNHYRWIDLYDKTFEVINNIKTSTENGISDADRWILDEFAEYWETIPGIYYAEIDSDWFPEGGNSEFPKPEAVDAYEPQWAIAQREALGLIPGKIHRDSGGMGFFLLPQSGKIFKLYVRRALKSTKRGLGPEFPEEIMQIDCSFKETEMGNNVYRIISSSQPSLPTKHSLRLYKEKKMIRTLIGVTKWKECSSFEEKQKLMGDIVVHHIESLLDAVKNS